jgi:hypothetical protein
MKFWTEKEITTLKQHYADTPVIELLKLLPGRTKRQIYLKANRMGLLKDPDQGNQDFNYIKKLNETGRMYWNNYMKELGDRFVDKVMLEDLCYWEQKKEKARKEVEECGEIFTYKTKEGKIKHKQQSAEMMNLRNIQTEITRLREKLYAAAALKQAEKKEDEFPKLSKVEW